MKAILSLRKSIFYVLALSMVVTLHSCDDDENDPKPLVVTDVNGSYDGTMYVSSTATPRDAQTESVAVSATFNANKATFADFPVDDFVIAIEGAEAAEAILEGMEAVAFEIEYDAKLNTAQDSILLTPKSKVLEFSYEVTTGEGDDEVTETKEVSVSIDIYEAKNAYAKKQIELNLVAEEIIVGGEDGEAIDPYEPQYLRILLKKK